jgi:dTDP-4-amino-4,6-dideoxygalactose transaminase
MMMKRKKSPRRWHPVGRSGPRVAEFEKAVAAHDRSGFGIATSNCTTALHLCMIAMGFGTGDDVIVPSYTFVATPNAVEYTGATAVFTDVDLLTYNIDIEKTRSLIEKKYIRQGDIYRNRSTGNRLAGSVPVNEFGLCGVIAAVNAIANDYHLRVIEDSACAFGAKIGNRHEGGFGNPSTLSFHPRKSISTGEGGMILTNDPDFADHVRKLRSHAASLSEIQRHHSKGYLLPEYNEIGFNYRMTDIQGAVGVAQMRKIDFITQKRAELAARYDRLLPNAVSFLKTPFVPQGYTHIYQTYAV